MFSGSTIDSTGTWIFRSSGLRTPVSTTVARRFGPTMKRPTSSSGFWVARQTDPLDVAARLLDQPLQRDRQVRAALGLRDGVDLVEDHRLGALEDRPRLAREHQVQRLGRGDQHVGRVLDHVAPLLLRRVAGADRDVELGADPAQRRAQVLLDVVATAPSAARRRRAASARGVGSRDEPVQPVQERGQRLARAGRRGDQHVLAGRDRRPRLRLRGRRLRERPPEPLANLRCEVSERIEPSHQRTVRTRLRSGSDRNQHGLAPAHATMPSRRREAARRRGTRSASPGPRRARRASAAPIAIPPTNAVIGQV